MNELQPLAGDYILYCNNLCIAIIIVFIMFMINPFIISAMSMQNVFASLMCVGYSNNAVIAEIENCELLNSKFYHIDLFSDLSRNMTPSSSDPLEATEDTGIQEEVESNTGADNLQNEATTGETNQSLSSPSPSSPSDLFEGNGETEEVQDGVENDANENIQEQDVITSGESPESNTNST